MADPLSGWVFAFVFLGFLALVERAGRWALEKTGQVLEDAADLLDTPADRQLAERLLFEHQLDLCFRADVDPEQVEIAAATGALQRLVERGLRCSVCGAGHDENCDAGLHC